MDGNCSFSDGDRIPAADDEGRVALAREVARIRFPLPPKRVLREEPDPNGAFLMWRFRNGHFESACGGADWNRHASVAPTPERVALWISLEMEPWREPQ